MDDVELLIQSAQKAVLDSYIKEFELLAAALRDLDAKAQGTATTAGVFLAATLAYLNRTNALDAPLKPLKQILMGLAVVCLIGSIIFSLKALRVRKLLGPPSGEDTNNLLTVLSKAKNDDELCSRLLYFYGDAANPWIKCVRKRREVNEEKAVDVWSAQISLTVTAIAIACIVLIVVIVG